MKRTLIAGLVLLPVAAVFAYPQVAKNYVNEQTIDAQLQAITSQSPTLTFEKLSFADTSYATQQGRWKVSLLDPEGPAVCGELKLEVSTSGLQAISGDLSEVSWELWGVTDAPCSLAARAERNGAQSFAEIVKDRPLIVGTTSTGLSGISHTHFATASLELNAEDENLVMSVSPLEGELAHRSLTEGEGKVSGMQLDITADGETVTIEGVEGFYEMVEFGTTPAGNSLTAGTMEITLNNIQTAEGKMGAFTIGANIENADAENVDIKFTYAGKDFAMHTANPVELGSWELILGLEDANTSALADLIDAQADFYQSLQSLPEAEAQLYFESMVQQYVAYAMEMLAGSRVVLEKAEFALSNGEKLELDGFVTSDNFMAAAADPFNLLQGQLNFAMSNHVIESLINVAQSAGQVNPAVSAAQLEQSKMAAEQTIAMLTAQGLLQKQEEGYRSTITLNEKGLLVNGQSADELIAMLGQMQSQH